MPAVAGQERDPAALDRADDEPVGGRAVRRVDGDLLGVVEEAVEARASEDSDLGFGAHISPPGVQILGRGTSTSGASGWGAAPSAGAAADGPSVARA